MTSLFFYDECISIAMRGESLEKTLYDNFEKRHRRKKSQKVKKEQRQIKIKGHNKSKKKSRSLVHWLSSDLPFG